MRHALNRVIDTTGWAPGAHILSAAIRPAIPTLHVRIFGMLSKFAGGI